MPADVLCDILSRFSNRKSFAGANKLESVNFSINHNETELVNKYYGFTAQRTYKLIRQINQNNGFADTRVSILPPHFGIDVANGLTHRWWRRWRQRYRGIPTLAETTTNNNNKNGQNEWKQNKITCNTEHFSTLPPESEPHKHTHNTSSRLSFCRGVLSPLSLLRSLPFRSCHEHIRLYFFLSATTAAVPHGPTYVHDRFTTFEWAHLQSHCSPSYNRSTSQRKREKNGIFFFFR